MRISHPLARGCRRWFAFSSWLKPLRRGRRRRLARQRESAVRTTLSAEVLEDRTLLAAQFVVTTTSDLNDPDDGVVSLREAIILANGSPNVGGPDRIEFDIPADDPGHVYYADDGFARQVSRGFVGPTTSVNDADLTDVDPDWQHSWYRIHRRRICRSSPRRLSSTVTPSLERWPTVSSLSLVRA